MGFCFSKEKEVRAELRRSGETIRTHAGAPVVLVPKGSKNALTFERGEMLRTGLYFGIT